MSLLLDALKKSEAQRRRGEVPTLSPDAHAAAGAGAPRRRRRGPVVLLLLLVMIAAAGSTFYFRSEFSGRGADSALQELADADEAQSSSAPSSGQAAPQADAAGSVSPEPPSPDSAGPELQPSSGAVADAADADDVSEAQQAPEPASRLESSPAAAASSRPAPDASAPRETRAATTQGTAAPDIPPEVQRARDRAALAARVAQQVRDGEVRPRAPRRGPAPAAADPVQPGSPEPPEPAPADVDQKQSSLDGAIRPWELPQALRTEFPELDLTVHFYASNPNDRFVIINGERFGEGSRPDSSVRIGEILERGVILDFRNYRILIE